MRPDVGDLSGGRDSRTAARVIVPDERAAADSEPMKSAPDTPASTDPATLDPSRAYRRILIIRHGALGDFVQSLGPMKAIRDFHPDARITLLTSPAMEGLAKASGLADDVWLDDRPPAYRLPALMGLIRLNVNSV